MTNMTPKASKAPRQTADAPPAKARPKVKKERRNRSKKQRPADVPGLIAAISSNTLDQRTTAARDTLALRDTLAEHPEATVKALIRDALALDGVIMSRIAQEILRPDSVIVDDKGELNPLIIEHWPSIRNGVLKSGRELMRMEPQKPKPKSGDADDSAFDLSFILQEEAQRDADSD